MNGAATDFLGSLLALSDAGEKERAIALVFDRFDDWQYECRFAMCDEVLADVSQRPGAFMPTLLCSFLTITLAGKQRLRTRADFYRSARRRYFELYGEERTQGILGGLE